MSETTDPLVSPPDERHGFDCKRDGRLTEIADYCAYRMSHGGTKCVFLCVKRGRRYYARDLQLDMDGPSLGLDKLRKHPFFGGWWKRYSLYSVVSVKELLIRVVDCFFEAASPESTSIRVVTSPFDYDRRITELNEAISELDKEDIDPFSCNVDTSGDCHDDNESCPNTTYNHTYHEKYCKFNRIIKLIRERDNYPWLSPTLEYYWQHGNGSKGSTFLKKMGFVYSYEELQFDRRWDAANPYGKAIRGFLVVEGWHVRYLLSLVAGTVLLSICVIAISAAASRKLDVALTAGSYVCGLATALIAVFSLLSAIV